MVVVDLQSRSSSNQVRALGAGSEEEAGAPELVSTC